MTWPEWLLLIRLKEVDWLARAPAMDPESAARLDEYEESKPKRRRAGARDLDGA